MSVQFRTKDGKMAEIDRSGNVKTTRSKKLHKKATTLNLDEEVTSEEYIDFYQDLDETLSSARRKAWKDLQEQYPRLRKYDGAFNAYHDYIGD